jgi:hypothetical protein
MKPQGFTPWSDGAAYSLVDGRNGGRPQTLKLAELLAQQERLAARPARLSRLV